MEAVGRLMFCESCGEMAFVTEGDGETYYERIESSVNPYRAEHDNDKPKMEDYEPGTLARKIPRVDELTVSLEEPQETTKGTLLGKKSQKKKTDYEIDMEDWYALDEVIPRFKQIRHGRELMKKGVKYAQCKNPYCEFHGPAAKVKKDGKEIDFDDLTSKHDVVKREYEVIKDSDKMQGILTKDTYMCPKCDCVEVYAYLEQTRSSDEPETRMLTCKDCGNGWREY